MAIFSISSLFSKLISSSRRSRRKTQRPQARPRLEQLESRLTPTTGPVHNVTQNLFYSTIQAGINGANPGDTIQVAAGTYAGQVNVNQSVILEGAEFGSSATTRYSNFTTGSNGPAANPSVESVILPSAVKTDGTTPYNDLFIVTANNVTIDGFVFDGYNGSLTQTGNTQVGGLNVDAEDAISNFASGTTATAISGLVVQNDIVQNFALSGVILDGAGAAGPAINNLIQNNVIANIGNTGANAAYNISLNNNGAADIKNNTLNVAADFTGIYVFNFSNISNPMTFSGNTITVGQDAFGIEVNIFGSSGSSLSIASNAINAPNGVTGSDANGFTWGVGIYSVANTATVSLTSNTIGNLSNGGTFDRGIDLWNDLTDVSVSGGTIGSSLVGVELQNVNPFFGSTATNCTVSVTNVAISGATTAGVDANAVILTDTSFLISGHGANKVSADVAVNVSGGSLTGSGIGVFADAPTNTGSYTAAAQISGDPSITGGVTGIEAAGPFAGLTFTGANPPASISGQSGNYISLVSGALASSTLDASQISFGSPGFVGASGIVGGPPSASVLATYYGIENKITDNIDDSTLGYISLAPSYVFVTQQSETTNAGAIARALNVAAANNAIDIQAGTFAGNFTISKQVYLSGAGSTVNPSTGTIIQSTVSSTPVITVTGSGPNISQQMLITGIRVTGATGSGDLGAGILIDSPSTGFIQLIGIAAINNAGNGISINGTTTTISNVLLSNINSSGSGTDLSIANKVTGTNLAGGLSLGGSGLGLAYSGTLSDTLNLDGTLFAGSLSNYITTSSSNAITAVGTVFDGAAGATVTITITGASAYTIGYQSNTAVQISSTQTVTFNGTAPGSTLVTNANGTIIRVKTGSLTEGSVTINYTNVKVTNLNNAVAVQTIAGPNTAARSTAFSGLTADERFVQALYLDDLGRAGSKAELDGWVTVLHGAGGSQNLVVTDIEQTQEAQDFLVKSWYLTFLGRAAKNNEEQPFVNMLLAGQSEEQVLSNLLGDPGHEFYNRCTTLFPESNANQSYVQGLYMLLLGRTGSVSELNGWVNQIPTIGLVGVALDFQQGSEFRGYLFEGYYNALLRRTSDPSGLSGWVNSSSNALAVRIAFESTNEFYNNG